VCGVVLRLSLSLYRGMGASRRPLVGLALLVGACLLVSAAATAPASSDNSADEIAAIKVKHTDAVLKLKHAHRFWEKAVEKKNSTARELKSKKEAFNNAKKELDAVVAEHKKAVDVVKQLKKQSAKEEKALPKLKELADKAPELIKALKQRLAKLDEATKAAKAIPEEFKRSIGEKLTKQVEHVHEDIAKAKKAEKDYYLAADTHKVTLNKILEAKEVVHNLNLKLKPLREQFATAQVELDNARSAYKDAKFAVAKAAAAHTKARIAYRQLRRKVGQRLSLQVARAATEYNKTKSQREAAQAIVKNKSIAYYEAFQKLRKYKKRVNYLKDQLKTANKVIQEAKERLAKSKEKRRLAHEARVLGEKQLHHAKAASAKFEKAHPEIMRDPSSRSNTASVWYAASKFADNAKGVLVSQHLGSAEVDSAYYTLEALPDNSQSQSEDADGEESSEQGDEDEDAESND